MTITVNRLIFAIYGLPYFKFVKSPCVLNRTRLQKIYLLTIFANFGCRTIFVKRAY